jgi:predicted ribosomally synthesized peptide with nif11-like leader
MEVTKHLDTL